MSPLTPHSPSPTTAAEARPGARFFLQLLLARVGWGLGLLAAAALARVMARQLFLDEDTQHLLQCADGVRACLSEGRWSGCTEAGKWPLLQYGPALLVRLAGGSLEDAGRALAYRLAPGTDMPKRALLYPALLALGCLWLRRSVRSPQSNL